uniref:Uncharacterized protein n=1 Tax=Siphoviridae sp. ctmYS12 TaxID=2825652 RepID=A0A8S5P8R6_9CAUD|nr:MAG TPA: hypothetical protein [Siphoviridae sp. ctmYS12]
MLYQHCSKLPLLQQNIIQDSSNHLTHPHLRDDSQEYK